VNGSRRQAADKIALHRPAGSFPPNNNYYRIPNYLTFRYHGSAFVPSNFLLVGFRINAFASGYIGANTGPRRLFQTFFKLMDRGAHLAAKP